MITSTTPQLEIPSEMRAVAERSIQRAKLAFDNYIRATEGAASMVEERVEASQVGRSGGRQKGDGIRLAQRDIRV